MRRVVGVGATQLLLILGVISGCSKAEDGDAVDPGVSPSTGTPGTGLPQAGAPAQPGIGPGQPALPPGSDPVGPPPGVEDPAEQPNPGAPTVDLPADLYGEVISPAAIPAECQGFKLDGLRYSPGGTVLPNKCEPFHATTNNPYAVRCIDAWSHYETGFLGDQYCLLPPPPDRGIQFGMHPQGPAWFAQAAAGDLSGYQITGAPWVLPAGGEETVDFASRTDNAAEHNYYRQYYRMRTGSHHNIITSHTNSAPAEQWLPGGNRLPGSIDPTLGPLIVGLGGAQRPDDNVPFSLGKPIEDAEIGLYRRFPKGGPGGAYIVFNVHHFNSTDGPILKETWQNFWWEEDARTPALAIFGLDVGQVLLLAMRPGETRDLHYVFNIQQPTRALQFFGHRHVWTPNFSAWVERGGTGAPEIIYQSFDWFDVPTYRYDSETQNPSPTDARTDGGSSGVLNLNPGDELHFNCHIEFTDARAAATGVPSASSIGALRFANEAMDAEMCILFGGVTTQLPATLPSPEPVPAFAK